MQKHATINRLFGNRKLSIVIAGVIIILVILDLFTTRQILYLNNASQIVLFVLTAGIGWDRMLDSFRVYNTYYQRSEG